MTAGFAVVLAGQPPRLSGLGVCKPSLLCPGNRVSECRAKVQQLVPIPGRPQLGRTSTTPASSPGAHTVSAGAWGQLNSSSPPSRPWGGSCNLTVPLGLKNEHTHTRHTQGSETRSIKSSPRKTWGNCVTLWFKRGTPTSPGSVPQQVHPSPQLLAPPPWKTGPLGNEPPPQDRS